MANGMITGNQPKPPDVLFLSRRPILDAYPSRPGTRRYMESSEYGQHRRRQATSGQWDRYQNAKDAIFGVTPLSGVTLTGQTEMVESLIQQGVMLTPKIKMVEQPCIVPFS